MLTNENTTTLGGSVATLDRAKQSCASPPVNGSESLHVPSKPSTIAVTSRQGGAAIQSVAPRDSQALRRANQALPHSEPSFVTSCRVQPQVSSRQQVQKQLLPGQSTPALPPRPGYQAAQHLTNSQKLNGRQDQRDMVLDEDGILSGSTGSSGKTEEEEIVEIEKMYSEEFEMMDEDHPPSDTSRKESKQPACVVSPGKKVVQANVIDITEDDSMYTNEILKTRNHVDSPQTSGNPECRSTSLQKVEFQPELPDHAKLEASFSSSDVVNLDDIGPRGFAAPLITKNILAPEKCTITDDFVPSPPSDASLTVHDTTVQEYNRINGGVATINTPHSVDKKRRIFFNDIQCKSDVDKAVIARLCKEGYIEGKAISIKKFSVIEKKVKTPYFLTKLEFSDGNNKQDVNICSELCEIFLKMSAQEYIHERNDHIQRNNLDKKLGSNDFKKTIAQNFGKFCGKFVVSYADDEFVLQEIVSDDALEI